MTATMKKLGVVAVLFALVASIGLFGCSSNNESKDNNAESADYTLLNDGKLVVGLSPDYPPFENLEGDDVVGFEVELGKALAEELGLEYENKNLQFDAIIPAVVSGGQVDIGMSGFTVTPEREEQIDFTDAFYIDDQAVAVMKDEGITEENAAEALNQDGIIIAVQSGTTGETYAQENYPNATIQPYGNSTDCFAAMQSGQADAVCTNKAVVEKMITLGKKQGLANYRRALSYLTKEDVAKKLFDEVAPKYAERNGGYTRVTRIGPRRGDAAEVAVIELV